jgi:hypothetical protein
VYSVYLLASTTLQILTSALRDVGFLADAAFWDGLADSYEARLLALLALPLSLSASLAFWNGLADSTAACCLFF